MSYDFGEVGEQRRRTMRAIESEGTEPERQAAEALDALGVGYEEQPRYGRYQPDFRLEDGTMLQVMGCWFHGCPCQHGQQMSDVDTNKDYWSEKLEKNRSRDKRRRRELLGKHGAPYVFWVWEHEDISERVASLCEFRGLIDDG